MLRTRISRPLFSKKADAEPALGALDLTDRNTLVPELAIINSPAKNVLVITEGVTLYMTASQVNDLAADLRAQTNFVHWINDYVSPRLLKVLGRRRMRDFKNVPFQFVPPDWFAFFAKAGWKARQIKYLVDESLRIGRRIPMPWWARTLLWMSPRATRRIPKVAGLRGFRTGSVERLGRSIGGLQLNESLETGSL
jgi:hypothetical protein